MEVAMREETLPRIKIRKGEAIVHEIEFTGPVCARFKMASAGVMEKVEPTPEEMEAYARQIADLTEEEAAEVQDPDSRFSFDLDGVCASVDTLLPDSLRGQLGLSEYQAIFLQATLILCQELGHIPKDDDSKKSERSAG